MFGGDASDISPPGHQRKKPGNSFDALRTTVVSRGGSRWRIVLPTCHAQSPPAPRRRSRCRVRPGPRRRAHRSPGRTFRPPASPPRGAGGSGRRVVLRMELDESSRGRAPANEHLAADRVQGKPIVLSLVPTVASARGQHTTTQPANRHRTTMIGEPNSLEWPDVATQGTCRNSQADLVLATTCYEVRISFCRGNSWRVRGGWVAEPNWPDSGHVGENLRPPLGPVASDRGVSAAGLTRRRTLLGR